LHELPSHFVGAGQLEEVPHQRHVQDQRKSKSVGMRASDVGGKGCLRQSVAAHVLRHADHVPH
jgi:hypothetical protein